MKPRIATKTIVQDDVFCLTDPGKSWDKRGEYKPDYPGNYRKEGETFYRPKWNLQNSGKNEKKTGR